MRRLESKDVVKGSELMLEAQVSGSAPFTVSLSKNGKAIRNDKRHRITVKDELIALQVLGVEAGDVGSYQCTVENEVGGVSCDCHVTLKGLSKRRRASVASVSLGAGISGCCCSFFRQVRCGLWVTCPVANGALVQHLATRALVV